MIPNIRIVERREGEDYIFYSLEHQRIYSFSPTLVKYDENLVIQKWKTFIDIELEGCITPQEYSEGLTYICSLLPLRLSEGYTSWISNYISPKLKGIVEWYPRVSYSCPNNVEYPEEDYEEGVVIVDEKDEDTRRYIITTKGLFGKLPRCLTKREFTLGSEEDIFVNQKAQIFDLEIRKGSYLRVINSELINRFTIKEGDYSSLIDKEIEVNQKDSQYSLILRIVGVKTK